MSLVRIAFCLLSMLLLQACETVPAENTVVIKADTVLVLPATSMHSELAKAYDDVQNQVAKGVKKADFKVVLLRGEAWEKVRNEALTVSGSMYDPKMAQVMPLNPGAYIKAMIDLLREHNDYDVILVPELVVRTAVIQGDEALWDGVEREFTWSVEPEDTYVLPKKASGLSLRISAYTDKGALLFQSFNGISLPYDLRLEKGRFQFDLKQELFKAGELKDAVKAAMETFEKHVEYDD